MKINKLSLHDLPKDYQELCLRARQARKCARAYISNFLVGSAVLTDTGEIFTGSNNESADYTLTVHAEMNAINHAVHAGHTDFKAIAVQAGNLDKPVAPCGLCRQKIREYGQDIDVLMLDKNDNVWIAKIDELLPLAFTPKDLGYDLE